MRSRRKKSDINRSRAQKKRKGVKEPGNIIVSEGVLRGYSST